MAKYTGEAMVVKYGTTDVSANGRQLEVEETADEVDTTTYGSTEKEFITGMVERTATLEVLDEDSANAAIRSVFKVGTSNSLTWYPKGTNAGNQKFSAATTNVLSRSFTYPYDEAVLMSCNLRISGPVVEGTSP